MTLNEYKLTDLPLDDRACLRLMLELQRDAASALLHAATRDLDPANDYSIDAPMPLTQFDYSGDHIDYNTAAANLLAAITNTICDDTLSSAHDALASLFTDDDFLADLITADFSSPLLTYIDYPD